MGERNRGSWLLGDPGDLPRPFAPAPPRIVEPDERASPPGPDPVEEAYARGRREGLELGRRESGVAFEAQAEELGRRLAETLGRLSRVQEEQTREHESRMGELALEAASRIVRERVDADDPIAARALREALVAVPAGGGLVARLHPADAKSAEKLLADEIAARRIEIVADDNVGRGGCILELASGTIDATLETATETVMAQARTEPS